MKAICPSALRGTGVAVDGRGVGGISVAVGSIGVAVGGTGVGVGGTDVGAGGFGVAVGSLAGCSVSTGSTATSAGVTVGGVARGLVDVQAVTSIKPSANANPTCCSLVLMVSPFLSFLHLRDAVVSGL
jgi:hypothetical protein